MDVVIVSIKPKWWDKIRIREKLLEVRKTKPTKITYPFKIVWYETGGVGVVGESICPEIISDNDEYLPLLEGSCIPHEDLLDYGRKLPFDDGDILYGWRLRDTVEYEKPRPLSDYGLKRPPQSWQYLRN